MAGWAKHEFVVLLPVGRPTESDRGHVLSEAGDARIKRDNAYQATTGRQRGTGTASHPLFTQQLVNHYCAALPGGWRRCRHH
jgi:hypothetical protein